MLQVLDLCLSSTHKWSPFCPGLSSGPSASFPWSSYWEWMVRSVPSFLSHPEDLPDCWQLSWHMPHHDLQFIGLESIITSLSDIYPACMRKGYCREIVLFLICAFCFLVGQLLVSQVSRWTGSHLKVPPPKYPDQVCFYVWILGRHVHNDDIWSLRMQRPCSPSAGGLPVSDYWMDLWWGAQSVLGIFYIIWGRGHFTCLHLQVQIASVTTLQTWSGTDLMRWSNTAGCTSPLLHAW